MSRRATFQFIAVFIGGAVFIVPLMNQGGFIDIYEAILVIWILFLAPAYLGYRSFFKTGNKKTAKILSIALYLMVSSLYSLVEPILAGYNIGIFVLLIPLPVSFIIMIPSLYISYISRNAKPRDLAVDEPLTEWLRTMVEAIGLFPAVVVISTHMLKIGSRFVSNTDGPVKQILISPNARELFSEEELRAAVLKQYYEMQSNSSLKLIYKINLVVMLYVDAFIILVSAGNMINNGIAQFVIVLILVILVSVLFTIFPLYIRYLSKKKECLSDKKAAITLGETTALNGYITKSAINYIVNNFTTPKRQNRSMQYQNKLADIRLKNLEKLELGN